MLTLMIGGPLFSGKKNIDITNYKLGNRLIAPQPIDPKIDPSVKIKNEDK